MSKGAEQLLKIVKDLFPNHKVVLEYNVADRGSLFIDIYLPRLKLAFEFDGEQHHKYVEHFHGDRQGFIKAQKRDHQKDELCEQKGITMIRVGYNEELTRDVVLSKVEEALGE